MLAGNVVEVVREIAATDPTTCDAGELRVLAERAHPGAVLARRRRRSSGESVSRAGDGGRRSSREADVIAERASVCEAMPEVHAALSAGTLSAGHADAIARACNRLDEREQAELAALAPTLVEQASTMSVDVFARRVRDLARRISRDEPRDAPQRPPRSQHLRDVRRSAAPASNGPPDGVRSGHHPDRVGRRRQSRRRRTRQTPRLSRSTPSTPSDAPDLRRTRLPRALR